MRSINHLECMAGTTGLEPATSAVTGQHSNQLNYVPFAIEAYRRALRSAFVASVRYSLRSERTTELSPFRSLDCSKTECAQGTEFRKVMILDAVCRARSRAELTASHGSIASSHPEVGTLSTAERRWRTRSLPRAAMTAKRLGATAWPVSATRDPLMRAPALMLFSAAKARRISSAEASVKSG